MDYVRFGATGLSVSRLCLGCMTYGDPAWREWVLDEDAARPFIRAAWEAGINFFDTADMYSLGASETVLGRALKDLARRDEVVIATKVYNPMGKAPNQRGLSRKHVMEGIDGSLKRLGMDYVDLIFCHRPDPNTPVEETVWAMHDIVSSGKALYWGTSEWSAAEIMAAWQIADRHHLHKPQMEQPQYNMLWRNRVEKEYARLYGDIGLGLTIWSPLASGLLTGKYAAGLPADSRAALPGYEWLRSSVTDEGRNAIVKALEPVANDLGCTLAQMAIAWCVKNPNVSTVITGASRVSQVHENMQALNVVDKLTPDVIARIESILNNKPE
jgi:voltage-dependent potassium channel beta subunit